MNHLNPQYLGPTAQQHIGTVEQGTVTQQLTHRTQRHHHAGSPQANRQAVQCGQTDRFFRGYRFGAANHDTVGDDQRDKYPQRLIKAEGIGVDQHLHNAHRRSDDHYVNRDTDFIRHPAAYCGYRGVGQYQHQRGRQPQPEGVGDGRGHCQQRAHPQQLHQRGVILPQPLDNQIFGFTHSLAPHTGKLSSLGGSVSIYNAVRRTALTTARGVMVAPVN
ncbi:hypothetical protein D3C78_1184600 [compost metagenome]